MEARASGGRLAAAWRRPDLEAVLDRYVPWVLAAAMVAAAATIVWLSRDTTMTVDELVWFMETPGFDADTALQPHGGHLTLSARIVYAVFFNVFGAGYLPFRFLVAASVLLTAGLFFIFASRRIGRLAALAPTLVLLFFGSDSLHFITGNGFTIHLALSCGIGALLALERNDRPGDVLAAVLLVVGVATYTVALGFVLAAAVLILLGPGSPRRLWVPAIPLALYAAWWIWSLGTSANAESAVVLSNVLLIPAASFQALGATLMAIFGLNYPFGGAVAQFGPALVLAAVAALAWRIRRGPLTPLLVATAAVPLVLWTLISVAKLRAPTDPRYLYPGAVAVLLVAASAAAGLKPSRFALVALYIACIAGVATNLAIARDTASDSRATYTPQVRTELAAIELAKESVSPEFDPARIPGHESPLLFPFAEVRVRGEAPTGAYLRAADELGSPAYDLAELEAGDEAVGSRADVVLAAAYELSLSPREAACIAPDVATESTLLPGTAVITPSAGPVVVAVRRFADRATVPLGRIAAGETAVLAVPSDSAGLPWTLVTSGPAAVCAEG